MAAQATMLVPPHGGVSAETPHDLTSWAPASSLDRDREPSRSQCLGALLGPKVHLKPRTKPNGRERAQACACNLSAQSLQFVASPGRANKLQTILPAAIREAFSVVPAFAGCIVMVSEQEARRVTIVTFWKGNEHRQQCGRMAEQLKEILFPYVDHWLRTENHLAHFLIPASPGEPEPLSARVSKCDSTVNA